MGLLTKLFHDASDAEFKLAQDLVAIAMADGEISDAERKIINELCLQEGITSETINDCMLGFDKDSCNLIPTKRRDKMDYLSKLVRVMGVDGNSSHMEIYLLEIIASKMGVSRLELVSIVLATATRKNFPGDTGTKVLTSFLKNVIDPKNKQLCDNRDNIKRLFDMIAQNIPQQENEEEDQTTFVKAMNAATCLLMENSLLCHEFQSMGIDFETLLMTEKDLAIRRWTGRFSN